MLKLELDWASDDDATPPVGCHDDGLVIELVRDVGPAGWPVVAVYAPSAMTLWTWLYTSYVAGDSAHADDLASMADVV